MGSQFIPLLRNEITKALRRKLPYFGILAVALVCVVSFFVSGQISTAAGANGWGYVAFSMQLVFTDIGPILIVMFTSMLLAEETGTGTIRAVLAAPVHRWELFLAKAAIGILYMLAVSLAALLFSIAFAKAHYEFGAVGDSFGVVYARGRTLHEFLTGYCLSWIPLTALVMYGLLISTLIRNAGVSVSVGVSTLFLIDLTKHLVGFDPYIFTRYIGYSWVTLQQLAQGMDYQWHTEVPKLIALSVISGIVLFAAGLTIFVRKDLNH